MKNFALNNPLIIVFSLTTLYLLGFSYVIFKAEKHNPTKQYPVEITLYGEQTQSTFDCDSVTNEGVFQYAWKDSVRIPLKNVFEIKFN